MKQQKITKTIRAHTPISEMKLANHVIKRLSYVSEKGCMAATPAYE